MKAPRVKSKFQSEFSHKRSKKEIGSASNNEGNMNSDTSQVGSVSTNARIYAPKQSIKMSPWSNELDFVVCNFPKMDKNLDGYIGFERLSQTIKIAKAFLNKLYRSDIGAPHIAPHDEDTILFEWYFPYFEVIVCINSIGEFEYCLATIGKDDKYEYEDFESESEKNCLAALNKWFSMILENQK